MANRRRSLGNFNAPSSGSGSKGIGINTIMPFISSQAAVGKQNDLVETAGENADKVLADMGGNAPPGTTFSQGGLNKPLNRELKEHEQKSIAAKNVYGPVKHQVQDLIRGGVLNSKKGLFGSGMLPDADRTVRQMSAQAKSPLATYYDSKLQRLQSKLSKLKELMFERGGTALTPTEESILGSAFILEGKNDNQILEDLDLADAMVEEKARLSLEGANSAIPTSASTKNQNSVGRIRVKNKISGQTGTISEAKFDPNKYEMM